MNRPNSSHLAPPDPPLAHAISGSLGSALALLVLYPLERIRTELQSSAATTATTTTTTPVVDAASPANLDVEHQAAGDDPEEHTRVDSPHSGSTGSAESWITLTASENEEHDSERIIDAVQFQRTSAVAAASLEVTGLQQSPPPPPPQQQLQRETLVQCLIRLHVQRQLYKGVGPVVTTMGITNFVFFFAHSAFKKMFRKMTTSRALTASTLAGITNVLLTNPLWVANLRIIKSNNKSNYNNHHSSLWSELKQIVQQEGLASLWSGTLTSLLLVSNPVIQFFCYEQLRHLVLVRSKKQYSIALAPVQAFCLGALAKSLATVLTYPLQLAQVLLRLPDNEYKGTMDCLVRLAKEQGSTALFVGLNAKLLQTTLTAALQFLSYEQILNIVQTTLFSTRS